jgi:hypothetical protein
VTFGDDKKGKVLSIDVIKVNDYFTLKHAALVDRLRYNLLSISVAGQNPPGSSVSTTRGAGKPTMPPMEPRDL